jgi:hypothetical protein
MKIKISQLRQIIREELNSLREWTIRDFRNNPGDSWNDTSIKLILDRKPSSNAAVYRIENDNWFRRWEGPAKGYGLMIRKIKVSKTPIQINSWATGPNSLVYRAMVVYLPGRFDGIDDDRPENWEKSEALIVLGNKATTGFEMFHYVKPADIENFVNSNISKYKP